MQNVPLVSRGLGGGWVGGFNQSWHQRSLSAKRPVVSRELGGGWVGGFNSHGTKGH